MEKLREITWLGLVGLSFGATQPAYSASYLDAIKQKSGQVATAAAQKSKLILIDAAQKTGHALIATTPMLLDTLVSRKGAALVAATTGAAGLYLAHKYWDDTSSRLKKYGARAAAIALMTTSASSIALHFGLNFFIGPNFIEQTERFFLPR